MATEQGSGAGASAGPGSVKSGVRTSEFGAVVALGAGLVAAYVAAPD